MYTLEKIKKNIAKEINAILNSDVVDIKLISYPPNKEMGDLSLPMFQVAKNQGKNPIDIATDIMSKMSEKKDRLGIATITRSGPYLNFKIKQEFLAKEIIDDIEDKKEKYGENEDGGKKRVMIEFSNVNTHKEYHLGHLRNVCFGDSVSKLVRVNGFTAIPVSYINDFGIHVAKTLWGLNEFFKETEVPENKGEFLGSVYVKSSKESKDNKLAKGMIEGMMKKIESRKGDEYELWQKTREWSIEQFDKVYKELGVEFEHIYYESEYIDKGRTMVPELLKKGILKESQGAIIADLEKYNLGVLVVVRSDGTATYPVADLPLSEAKFKDYKLDKSIYVVDNRQKLYFKQLFKILELMGYSQEKIHLEYDFVKLPSGMMSSRSGNSVKYADLRDRMIEKASEETRKRHEDWSEEKIEITAKTIALGAMKFEMLKIGSDQVITFDIKKALDFRGYTAAYLQYTYARACGIIEKSKISQSEIKNLKFSSFADKKEHSLILKLAKYPEIIVRAGERYDPSEIAKYLFELAQSFNDYYHSVNILKSEKNLRLARLGLVKNVNQVISNGLKLLGINSITEM